MSFQRPSRILSGLALLAALGVCTQARAQEPSPAEVARAEHLLRLRVNRDYQLSRNQRWQVPAVVTGTGVATILGGALLIIHSGLTTLPAAGHPCREDEFCANDRYFVSENGDRRFAAGVALVSAGSLLTLIGVPMLSVRLARVLRVRNLERRMRQHGVALTWAPELKPGERAGLSARLRF